MKSYVILVFTITTLMYSAMYSTQVLAGDNGISLQQAIELAVKQDPKLQAIQNKAEAYREASVAANALPDPQLKLGLMNVPVDTFDFAQENMTQKQIGISQMFPAGDTLEFKSRQQLSMATAEEASAHNQLRMIKRDLRHAWLDLYYWQYAEQITHKTHALLNKLISTIAANYASGRQRQQDILRTELELELIEDRLDDIAARQSTLRAQLNKLLGQNILPESGITQLPDLPEIPHRAGHDSLLTRHPKLQLQQARLDATVHGVSLAEQSYKPDWMLDVTYGFREDMDNGTARSDFASVMLKVDLPLFTGNLQDRKVSASKYKKLAASEELELARRELQRQYQSQYFAWQKLSARAARFKNTLLPKAIDNSEASLFAYRSDRGQFVELIRDTMTRLDVELKGQRLLVKQRKMQANLLALLGDE